MTCIQISQTHKRNLLVGKESDECLPDGGTEEVKAGEEGAEANPVTHQIPLKARERQRSC